MYRRGNGHFTQARLTVFIAKPSKLIIYREHNIQVRGPTLVVKTQGPKGKGKPSPKNLFN